MAAGNSQALYPTIRNIKIFNNQSKLMGPCNHPDSSRGSQRKVILTASLTPQNLRTQIYYQSWDQALIPEQIKHGTMKGHALAQL